MNVKILFKILDKPICLNGKPLAKKFKLDSISNTCLTDDDSPNNDRHLNAGMANNSQLNVDMPNDRQINACMSNNGRLNQSMPKNSQPIADMLNNGRLNADRLNTDDNGDSIENIENTAHMRGGIAKRKNLKSGFINYKRIEPIKLFLFLFFF